MKSPLISIIIPVYKVEQYIRKCLDSVLAQTYADWECILVDDGSPDDSGVICDEYAQRDSRFCVIHKENGGVSSARNIGMGKANGEWITFVDADDWLTNDALETLCDAAIDNPADLITCKHVMATDNFGQQITNNPTISKKYTHEDAFARMIDYRLFTGPVAKLFKKQMVGNIRFIESVKIGEDQLFCLEYLIQNKIGVVAYDKPIYYYYQNEQSALHSQKSFRKLYADLLELIKTFLKDNQLYGRYEAEYHSLKFKLIRQAAIDEGKGFSSKEKKEIDICYLRCKHLLRPYLRHYYLALKCGQPICSLYCKYYDLKMVVKNIAYNIYKHINSIIRL